MKYLTDEDVKFKGEAHYNALKQKFNSDVISELYEKKLKFGESIGYVSALMKKFAPTSLEQAYDSYIVSGIIDSDLPRTQRGRTAEELEELAIEWHDYYGKGDIPLVEFYDALVLHAIVETYVGYSFEAEAKRMLDENGFETSWASDYDDGKYAVDIIANKDGRRYFIQVKPVSFFVSNRGHTTRDRRRIIEAMVNAVHDFGDITYKYLIYDKNTKMWLVNEKDGRCAFDYSTLVGLNGEPLSDIKKLTINETKTLFKNG